MMQNAKPLGIPSPAPAELSSLDDRFAGDDEDDDIKVSSLDLLQLDAETVQEVQYVWSTFLESAESMEAAGEALYSAIFEGAPTFQSLFVSPRAVQAMRFINGLQALVSSLGDPEALKVEVESLGFGHLSLEVTVPRVSIFRDAILELFEAELGEYMSPAASQGWKDMLSYVGGGIIFIKRHYADRLRLLADSWHSASGKAYQEQLRHQQLMKLGGTKTRGSGEATHGVAEDIERGGSARSLAETATERTKSSRFGGISKSISRRRGISSGDGGPSPGPGASSGSSPRGSDSPRGGNSGELHEGGGKMQVNGMNVKANMTYEEMFKVNLQMKGLTSRKWLMEVLNRWDPIVVNVANSARLQAECDVLALTITKCQEKLGESSEVDLGEYKMCMLAALRGCLPKVWDSSYEVAWNWLWENVERKLVATLGSPRKWEGALVGLLGRFSDHEQFQIRKSIYDNFFAAAPVGQDWFKQSNTRLHFIAERVLSMTMEIFEDPWKMVDEISALGLRHVGYGIPTELFGPFVTACIQVMAGVAEDQTSIEAFRWSLGLISKMLVDTINEGSTIVMKAINVNNAAMLNQAVSSAPRGKRAQWLLMVQVGTQSISPLVWALQSGSLAAGEAILIDLLTIRADRDRYYYGMEELFSRHPDIVGLLCAEGQHLLNTLLDGLVWRSRLSKDGMRRANYYVKHLIVTEEGHFSDALHHLAATEDPQIMSDAVVNLVSQTLWQGLVRRQFVKSKIWFVISLGIFMLGQAILPKLGNAHELWLRYCIVCCRCMTYAFTMMRLVVTNTRETCAAYRNGRTSKFHCMSFPSYLKEPYDAGSVILCVLLILMCCHEPYLFCAVGDGEDGGFPLEECIASNNVIWRYSVFSMWAMLTHWLLTMDLAVFSTGLSSFVLVCVHVLSEVGRFLVALVFCLLTFASAISVLEHSYKDMKSVGGTAVALFAITIRIFEDDYRDFQEDDLLLIMVFFFIVASAILLLNLLIAQLNHSYVYVYQNMVGFARLKRAEVIVQTINEDVREAKWMEFIATLGLDDKLEFNSGDIGISGGITVEEPVSLKVVTHDTIVRFGGSCSPDMQWPEDSRPKEETDKFDRMEQLIQRALKQLSKKAAGAGASANVSSGFRSSKEPGRSSPSGANGIHLSGGMRSHSSSRSSSKSEIED